MGKLNLRQKAIVDFLANRETLQNEGVQAAVAMGTVLQP